MPKRKRRSAPKHYRSRDSKARRTQKALDDAERDRLAREANERFLKSGIEVRDVFGKLDD